jgi:hypothetical protein
VTVEDHWSRGALVREIDVRLVGLAPRSPFTLRLDGVEVGRFETDAAGDGGWSLRVQGSGWSTSSLLPRAERLREASVLDDSRAFVLDGSFATRSGDDGGSSLHEERIPLSGAGSATGIAKVEREADGRQELDTRATGLEPGRSYRIVVDGHLAGVRTANPVGQASLQLEAPDNEDPLPPQLQPVESLRVVQWLDSSESLVLSGTFTGVSRAGDDDGGMEVELKGTVGAVGAGGFELGTAGGTVEVRVSASTSWLEGLAGIGDLAPGMFVEAEGILASDGALEARKVKLED